jgi:hypothetical protein
MVEEILRTTEVPLKGFSAQAGKPWVATENANEMK